MAKDPQSGFLKDSSVIPSIDLSIPMPPDALPSADVVDIWVEYDATEDSVHVTPGEVHKDSAVRFRDPTGGKLRIIFLSPTGDETTTVSDSQLCTLRVGGSYHFKCFFT